MAESIDAAYFLVPRVEIENSRNYRITFVYGVTERGEDGIEVHTRTSNRNIDNVERRIRDLAEEALAHPPVESL